MRTDKLGKWLYGIIAHCEMISIDNSRFAFLFVYIYISLSLCVACIYIYIYIAVFTMISSASHGDRPNQHG